MTQEKMDKIFEGIIAASDDKEVYVYIGDSEVLCVAKIDGQSVKITVKP